MGQDEQNLVRRLFAQLTELLEAAHEGLHKVQLPVGIEIGSTFDGDGYTTIDGSQCHAAAG